MNFATRKQQNGKKVTPKNACLSWPDFLALPINSLCNPYPSLQTQMYFQLSLVSAKNNSIIFSGNKRQPKISLRSQAIPAPK